jgi:hypothetical protein
MHSNAMIALSVIMRPGTNALYVSEIIFCNSGRIRFTRHFDTTLYITLHRLIGLKSLSDTGFLILGIKTIAMSLIPSGITPLAKKSRTDLIISSFSVPQFHWKKQARMPSGPGAFVGPI